jgi:predicted transcriptional regulator
MKRNTIEVDDQVYDRLEQEAAKRLETPNTVLRRLLKLDEPQPSSRLRMNALSRVMDVDLGTNDSRIMSAMSYKLEDRIDLLASSVERQPSTLPLPTLPHHIPTTLEHTLQMIHLVRKQGYTRIDATKALAEWHRVAIPTITIKFTRLLGISAHEIDALLEPEREGDLVGLLVSNFPEYEEVIRSTVDG